jgi:hypothetical protein
VKDKHYNKFRYYHIDVGTMVVFTCGNPAVGFVKRMAKDKSWADVKWIQGIDSSYTSRVMVQNLRPLNGVLNYWMAQGGHTQAEFKYCNGNFYLPPGD